MRGNAYVKGACPHCGAKILSYVRKESVERFSDINYARDLAARGLYVSEEYL